MCNLCTRLQTYICTSTCRGLTVKTHLDWQTRWSYTTLVGVSWTMHLYYSRGYLSIWISLFPLTPMIFLSLWLTHTLPLYCWSWSTAIVKLETHTLRSYGGNFITLASTQKDKQELKKTPVPSCESHNDYMLLNVSTNTHSYMKVCVLAVLLASIEETCCMFTCKLTRASVVGAYRQHTA